MHSGTIAAGRIGLAVLRRLKPFGLRLDDTAPHRPSPAIKQDLGLTVHPDADSRLKAVDIVDLRLA